MATTKPVPPDERCDRCRRRATHIHDKGMLDEQRRCDAHFAQDCRLALGEALVLAHDIATDIALGRTPNREQIDDYKGIMLIAGDGRHQGRYERPISSRVRADWRRRVRTCDVAPGRRSPGIRVERGDADVRHADRSG